MFHPRLAWRSPVCSLSPYGHSVLDIRCPPHSFPPHSLAVPTHSCWRSAVHSLSPVLRPACWSFAVPVILYGHSVLDIRCPPHSFFRSLAVHSLSPTLFSPYVHSLSPILLAVPRTRPPHSCRSFAVPHNLLSGRSFAVPHNFAVPVRSCVRSFTVPITHSVLDIRCPPHSWYGHSLSPIRFRSRSPIRPWSFAVPVMLVMLCPRHAPSCLPV